jgi:hypothetical protein
MTRPRTNGPLSLMATTTDLPLFLLDDLRRRLSSTATASAPTLLAFRSPYFVLTVSVYVENFQMILASHRACA